MATVGRNDPCPCGSGEKYKRCCLGKGGTDRSRQTRIALWSGLAVLIAAILGGVFAGRDTAILIGVTGAAAIGAYLLFADPPPPKSGGNPGAINFGS